MDIVTHGMMGAVLAAPFMTSHPEAAAAFMFGNVLPDLDALSRLLGKRAFLASHQTWSHALPVIGGLGLATWAVLAGLGVHAPWAGLALALGMALHALTDWSNTFGITLLAPFSRERFCREWVFFIDSVVIALSVAALAGLLLGHPGPRGWELSAAYGLALLGYWPLKVALRRRAMRSAPPETVSLIPSALVPWWFFGCAPTSDDHVAVFRIDAWSGARSHEEEVRIFDATHRPALEQVPEFLAMRALSPAYHVVEATPLDDGSVALICKDLRTRNFGGAFGTIDLTISPGGQPTQVVFHV